ncbi:MAG: hypothetical protein J6E42_10290, partial [Firmicutes bacterium]|nr:hypothetical protein [Bacillota bacterium]
GFSLILAWGMASGALNEPEERTVLLEYGGVRQELRLEEPEEEVLPLDEEAVLREAQERISREMLGNNESWEHISGPLVFPQKLESGVFLRYETSLPERISAQGLVDGIGTGEGEDVVIRVTMLINDNVSRFSVTGRIVPPETEEEIAQALRLRTETMRTGLEQSKPGGDGTVEGEWNGVKVTDAPRKQNLWVVAVWTFTLFLLVFSGKYHQVEKQVERRKREIEEQLPLLMEQLILMMNAGLILSEALQLASEEEREEASDGESGSLFRDIRNLCQRALETRRPVTALLCEYAVDSGSAELVRFSTMLVDHMHRGSDSLVHQLKTERNYAVERQWKQKEGKCREMEVRLIGPQCILLAVILVLATGPVWIGM